jgi:leader peptidase (prepilin peptidase) / N-methyltransferase
LRNLAHILIFDSERQPKIDCIHCSHQSCWKCVIPLSYYIFHTDKHSFWKLTLLVLDIFSTLTLFALLETDYPFAYICSYFFFFSALLVTLYTDIQHMLISRFVTLYCVPIIFFLSTFNALPISLFTSITGALSGFAVLYTIAFTFKLFTKKDGLGQGDIDLITFIGACIGFLGWWTTLLVGSLTASIYGIIVMIATRKIASVKLPFGPFLIFGAIVYVLMQQTIFKFLLI